MHFLRIASAPAICAFTEFANLSKLQPLTIQISWAAFVTGAAQLILLFNIFWSMRHGQCEGRNHARMGDPVATAAR
jgi:hypothetical protein